MKLVWRVLLVLAAATPLQADIYQWEYVNPANPSLGKQPSATRAPGGAGVDAVPGVQVFDRNLTKAYLIGADLTQMYAYRANFTNADFTAADLTDAILSEATLTNATFDLATIRDASLNNTTSRGFTAAQLYSTASYQNQTLRGVSLYSNNLTGWDFSSQDLTEARLFSSILTGANFTGATIRDVVLGAATSNGFTAAQLYSTASYQSHDLSGVWLDSSDLTGWDLSGQNLTDAHLSFVTLLHTDFTNAIIDGATFYGVTDNGFTAVQLYSTASYQEERLRGVNLESNNLSGWDFAGVDLAGANLSQSDITGTDFTGANITGAILQWAIGLTPQQFYSTASYQNGDLSGVDLGGNNLTGWSFAGKKLEGAAFAHANLTDADFTGADVRGANLSSASFSGFTAQQLYSTASYQAGDLTGIRLDVNDLDGWNFEGQNLAHADLSANLEGANFRHAYLANAVFDSSGIVNQESAILDGADARGARIYLEDFSAAINLIHRDGVVHGVDLTTEDLWIVRDYDGDEDANDPQPPIAIHVEDGFTTNDNSTIEVRIEDDVWDSTISFEPGIAVTLDGTLKLTFASDVNLDAQIGRVFTLFDWTGVTPTGEFDVVSEHVWDLTPLYTTGGIMLIAADRTLKGDYNNDGVVNAADYTVWRDNVDAPAGTLPNDPNAGPIGAAQYATWRNYYGHTSLAETTNVPEPSTPLLMPGVALLLPLRSRVTN